ncbi:hypothetical protein [Planktothrix paucivesiculata]|uniref:Uncharacterized protein n=1 Tax=Planktothrix paucivesiculata PCC 9631 TaxID=671071 RepID=A0A7Z9BT73_9CYAN|nr:hypothetical protein [Planktothrix paucivesiculata]VXD17202.1 conserved hypothetical protein [Planktothrix paucivesiculata PCC 9631]
METKLNPELNLDVDLIIERLQSDGVFDCDRIPQHLVKQALSKWLSKIEDSINNEPDWWIRQFESKAFKSSIESFLDDYSQDSEGIEHAENPENKNEFAILS